MNAFEHIQEYLEDALSGEQRQEFEAQLARDPSLQAEVNEYQDAARLLQLHQQVVYKQMLTDYDAELKAEPAGKIVQPLWGRLRYAVAAAVVLLILVGIWRGVATNPYQQAFEPYPDRLTMRSGPEAGSLANAMEAYNAAEYEKAIIAFSQLADSTQAGVSFYKALSFLGTGKYPQAIHGLALISPEDPYYAQARWYLALALGLNEQVGEAQEILKLIAADVDHPHQDEAQALLD